MGGSKKWLRSLVGNKSSASKKQSEDEKSVPEKAKFWQKKKTFIRGRRSFYRERFQSYGELKEEKAAICIQTWFRGYLARRAVGSLKGTIRLKALVKDMDAKRQASNALNSMQTWIRLQTLIQSRRSCMVIEARIKQKKLQHKMKVEAELDGLEADWLDGCDTLEEVKARVHHREAAAIKRERAMAYAFNHQWKPNGKTIKVGDYEFDTATWGWSWLERWIAARPWENRLLVTANGKEKESVKRSISSTLKTAQSNGKSLNLKKVASQPTKSNGIVDEIDNKIHMEGK